MRKDESEGVLAAFRDVLHLNVIAIDAEERFLARLAGITDPEEKRIRIGHEFIAIFEEESKKIPDVQFLVQGTLYPDVIESKTPGSKAGHKIKSHHNVGGLPEHMALKLIEPLRLLFKDEVRKVGTVLGLPPTRSSNASRSPARALRCASSVKSRASRSRPSAPPITS